MDVTVWIVPTAFPDVRWMKHSVSQGAIVGVVKAEFCDCYQLSISQCQLRLHGELSSRCSAVISSDQVLQEVLGQGQDNITFNADFQPSVAFHTWLSFNEHTFCLPAGLSFAWKCSVQDIIAHMRSQCTPMSQGGALFFQSYANIAEAAPTAQLPAHGRVFAQGLQVLPHILEDLLDCARDFPAYGLLGHLPSSWIPSFLERTAEGATRMTGDAFGSQAQMLDKLPPDDSVPYRPGSYQNLLQSTLLLLKLATLTSSIGVETPNTQAALEVLWNTLRGLTNSMAKYACSNRKSGSRMTGNMSAEAKEVQYREDYSMSLLVVQLAVQDYCKAVKDRPAVAEACCKIMTALLQASQEFICSLVVNQIVCQEGLEALMTAMQTSRATAKTGFELLQCLTSSAQLPEADVAMTEAQLAKLQAVHCCVRLLCPQHPAAETQLIATAARWFGSEWVPTEECNKEHLPFLASVATFLSRIAQRQLAADIATSGKDIGSLPSWEAPSQSEWVTILRTCQLLLLTLAWLLDPAKTEPFMHGKDAHMQRLQLEKGLWGILHGVLIGHLQSHELKLENIALHMLEAATHALGRKGMASYQPLMELLRALLMRLARDTKLAEETRGKSEHGQSYLLKPLWGFMGVYATAVPKRQSAAHYCSDTAFEALWAFLQADQNIASILDGDHLPVLNLEACMQHLKGQLAAQMTAAACLCKLASMELHELEEADAGSDTTFDYCDMVLSHRGFKAMLKRYETGIQDPLPWPVEQTVALTLLLWRFSLLLKHFHDLDIDLARLELTHQYWKPQRTVLQKLSLKLLELLPRADVPLMLHRQLLRAAACSLQVSACPCCGLRSSLDANKSLGSNVANAMIIATSVTHTDAPKGSTDPPTSYSEDGLPSWAVTAMQSAPLCVLDMLVTEDKHWNEFGLRAFAVGIRTLSHAVCLALACRDSCKGSTFSSRDTPEDLCFADLVPYLNMTRQFCTRGDPSQHALHAATACCMLQLLCLLVHMAGDQQLDATTCRSTMTQCHERSKALRQADGPVLNARVIKNNMLFLSTKEALDDSNAMREALVPAIDAVMDTMRDLQKDATFAQALVSAANRQWSKDLGNTPETLAANLSNLMTGSVWRSELLAEIQCCFMVSQGDLSKGSLSTVTTPAIEAPVREGDPVETSAATQAAAEAASEAANTANAEAATKAAAKRAKKQRQKAKKQQQQGALQLQQQKQPDAHKQAVQQVPPQQPSPLLSFCSAVSMDSRSSSTSTPAPAVAGAQQAPAVAEAQQVPAVGDELATLVEAPAASAAMSQSIPAEAATGKTPSCASSDLAVQAPQPQPATPDTVCQEACSAQIQQTSPDSASDAPETHRPLASAERHAPQAASRASSRELPFGDLKQSFRMAHMPGRGDRLPTCGYQHIPDMLCCPITKEPYKDPVIAHDGYTYERTAIEQWLKINSTSPASGQLLGNMLLTPNRVISAMALDCTAVFEGMASLH